MKKFFFFLLTCFAALSSSSQVGIGTTTPDKSAALDISSNIRFSKISTPMPNGSPPTEVIMDYISANMCAKFQ